MSKSNHRTRTGRSRKTEWPASYATRMAFTIAELAELSTIGRSALYNEIAVGHLKLTKIGGRSVILAQDAKSWLEGCADRAPDAGAVR